MACMHHVNKKTNKKTLSHSHSSKDVAIGRAWNSLVTVAQNQISNAEHSNNLINHILCIFSAISKISFKPFHTFFSAMLQKDKHFPPHGSRTGPTWAVHGLLTICKPVRGL